MSDGTTLSEHKGRMGVWAQGDCVFFAVADAADACAEYRRAMTFAEIGISTHPPCVDALRVRGLLAEVGRLTEALEGARRGVDRWREAAEVEHGRWRALAAAVADWAAGDRALDGTINNNCGLAAIRQAIDHHHVNVRALHAAYDALRADAGAPATGSGAPAGEGEGR